MEDVLTSGVNSSTLLQQVFSGSKELLTFLLQIRYILRKVLLSFIKNLSNREKVQTLGSWEFRANFQDSVLTNLHATPSIS